MREQLLLGLARSRERISSGGARTCSRERISSGGARPVQFDQNSSINDRKTELRPRLLSGSLLGSDQAGVCLRAIIVEAGKPERIHEQIRPQDLAQELWPGRGKSTEALCRGLRSLNDARQDFLLRPTRQVIWIRTDSVRAAVESKRVTFLDTGAATFTHFVEDFRQARNDLRSEDSFGCWVVECIICAAVMVHTMRMQVVRPVAENVLHGVTGDSANALLRLYPLKLTLSTFIEQVRPLVEGLRKMIELEGNTMEATDSRSILSHVWKCEAGVETSEIPLPLTHSMCGQESIVTAGGTISMFYPFLEGALYNWAGNADQIMAEAMLLSAKIEDTMRFLEASLSCTRNRLLMFELWANVTTVSVGFGGFAVGVFGMNLNNYGLDSQPGMFFGISGVIILIMTAILIVALGLIIRHQRHYNNNAQHFGNNRFFRRIDDDAYVLSLCSELPDDGGSRLRRLLAELSEPELPQQGGALSWRRATLLTRTPPSQSPMIDSNDVSRTLS